MLHGIRGIATAFALCGGMLGCATPEQVEEAKARKAQQWGGRSFINTYRFAGPIAAYFEPPAPGAKGGRLVVWEEGRSEVVQGEWWIREDFRLCVKPNIYYKEMIASSLDRLACLEFKSSALQHDHFAGDVFELKARHQVPHVLSKADNEKFAMVMRSTPYYAPANGGFSEGLYPAHDSGQSGPIEIVSGAGSR